MTTMSGESNTNTSQKVSGIVKTMTITTIMSMKHTPRKSKTRILDTTKKTLTKMTIRTRMMIWRKTIRMPTSDVREKGHCHL
jgi:hypothetical protein